MKIVTNQEMKALDAEATDKIGISSLILMETAGSAAAEIISQKVQEKKYAGEILVFCGKGKNGGDGLVVARKLLQRKHKVRVFLCSDPSVLAKESLVNFNILKNLNAKITIAQSPGIVEEFFKSTHEKPFIVDALLGTGLQRELEGVYYDTIEMINRYSDEVIALDIASGVIGDSGIIAGTSIHASSTISFGFPKTGHFLAPGAARRGQLYNVDLGFPKSWNEEGDKILLTRENVVELIRGRDRYGHKNVFGHCLLIGGSPGRLGAITLAGQSSLRTGTGLVTVASLEESFPELEMKIPAEIMSYRIKREGETFQIPMDSFLSGFSSIVIGPGLGVTKDKAHLLKFVLSQYQGPVVLDADALNLISEFNLHGLLNQRPSPCVLTPHMGEMARLLKVSKEDIIANPLQYIRKAHMLTGAVIVLKGPTTLIHSDEGITYFNHSPNDGLAKAGSGDVLAGMIGSFLGQKHPSLDSAKLGVFIHSLAGQCAADRFGERSMTSFNIIENLDQAFREFLNPKPSGANHAYSLLF